MLSFHLSLAEKDVLETWVIVLIAAGAVVFVLFVMIAVLAVSSRTGLLKSISNFVLHSTHKILFIICSHAY